VGKWSLCFPSLLPTEAPSKLPQLIFGFTAHSFTQSACLYIREGKLRLQRESTASLNTGLRLRSDLEIYPQSTRKRRTWVIKDPLSMRYYTFKDEEYQVMCLLNGRRDLDSIKKRFELQFKPQRVTSERLHAFVVNLHRNGLVLANQKNQGDEMLLRHNRSKNRFWVSTIMNPLSIRLSGVNPQKILNWVYPKISWLMSPASLVICTLVALSALILVSSNFDQVLLRLPQMEEFLNTQNLFWLGVALVITKFLHELGHAFACKHYGGECYELGIMFLVFTPCLYCNVSDAWKLSNRWHRIAITAAGIYVELILAAVCTFVWWFTQPGLINSLSLNVMVVCSVGTLVLNGNPLLRYDGYYILSDLLEIPNLWQNANNELKRFCTRFFAGYDPGNPLALETRPSMPILIYATASTVYRVIVITSILYFLFRFLTPLGLSLLATAITWLVVINAITAPLKAIWKHMTNPIVRQKVRYHRTLVSSLVCVILTSAFLYVPLPCKITVPLEIQPAYASNVYVTVPGRLLENATAGKRIAKGDLLARLENRGLKKYLEEIDGQYQVQRIRVRSLEVLRSQSPELGNELPTAKTILADLSQQRKQILEQLESLTLLAPTTGIILKPLEIPRKTAGNASPVAWHGTPLDPQNLGCRLEKQTLFCSIVQPQDFKALLKVNQKDIQYIRRDQTVQLSLVMSQGQILQGKITGISRKAVDSLPLGVPLHRDSTLEQQPQSEQPDTYYNVDVALSAKTNNTLALVGALGTARIQVEPQSLGLRLFRFLTGIFKPVS